MTISTWVFDQIILMVILSIKEIYQRSNFNIEFFGSKFFNIYDFFNNGFTIIINIIYSGLILGTDVIALTIHYRWIDHFKK
ncbi:hypothetical protein SDC9_162824 [bioreactor metagenome]|uniref:Uncharacterized protein n=1 Tax=bioreactor metagenome TaxID=1076179 RepID=A0A645FNH5_9ZZZZ